VEHEIKHNLVQRGDKFFIVKEKEVTRPHVEVRERMIRRNDLEEYMADGWKKRGEGNDSVVVVKEIKTDRKHLILVEEEVQVVHKKEKHNDKEKGSESKSKEIKDGENK
jgi:hypothetical protein